MIELRMNLIDVIMLDVVKFNESNIWNNKSVKKWNPLDVLHLFDINIEGDAWARIVDVDETSYFDVRFSDNSDATFFKMLSRAKFTDF